MKKREIPKSKKVLASVKHFIENTDIRILTFAPPIIGFVGLLIGMYIINLSTSGQPIQPIVDILLGIVFLLPCFSGYAEIYKREMPGPLGGIYKGNWAIVSGVLIIAVFGVSSVAMLMHGIGALIQ